MSSFALLEELHHCSVHSYHANGCADCQTAQQYHEHTTKLEKLNACGGIEIPYILGRVRKGGTHPLVIDIGNPSPKTQLVRQQMARMLAVFFAGAKVKAARAAGKEAKDRGFLKVTDDEKAIALAAYFAIEWDGLVDSMVTDLMAAYQIGVADAMMQLAITDENIQAQLDNSATQYANNRAAEMIGMKFVDDKLVTDSSAKFVIAETTKDDLQDVVEAAVNDNATTTELMERIRMAATFSDARMQFIAKNETNWAQVIGHTTTWRRSGLRLMANIVLSPAHKIYDGCDLLAEGGPYEIAALPIIPAHPECQCAIHAFEVSE